MSDPFVGEIRMFAGSFAPAGWQFCNGALLPISEFETLFNLIGTTYGGDGQATFALPHLAGRVPVHQGALSATIYQIGESAGVEAVTLNINQIPVHTHPFLASTAPAVNQSPIDGSAGNMLATSTAKFYKAGAATTSAPFSNTMVQPQGGSQPHENMMPYLTISYIISLFGIFPHQ